MFDGFGGNPAEFGSILCHSARYFWHIQLQVNSDQNKKILNPFFVFTYTRWNKQQIHLTLQSLQREKAQMDAACSLNKQLERKLKKKGLKIELIKFE